MIYANLLTTDKPARHPAAIDEVCEDRAELLIEQMAQREGMTETLKAADQMEKVRRMNSIRRRAEEIVPSGLVSYK